MCRQTIGRRTSRCKWQTSSLRRPMRNASATGRGLRLSLRFTILRVAISSLRFHAQLQEPPCRTKTHPRSAVQTELLPDLHARNWQDSSGRLHRADAADRLRHDRPGVRRSAVQHRLRVRSVPRPPGGRRVHRLVAAVDGRSASRPEAGRHVLAGDRRRVRGRAEGRRRAQDRLLDAQLGRVVLHVWRQLHARSSRARTPICFTS